MWRGVVAGMLSRSEILVRLMTDPCRETGQAPLLLSGSVYNLNNPLLILNIDISPSFPAEIFPFLPGKAGCWIIELLQSFIHLNHQSFLAAANKKGCNLNVFCFCRGDYRAGNLIKTLLSRDDVGWNISALTQIRVIKGPNLIKSA